MQDLDARAGVFGVSPRGDWGLLQTSETVRGHSLSRRGIPSEPKYRGSGLNSFQRQGLRLGFLELFVQPCEFLSNLKNWSPPPQSLLLLFFSVFFKDIKA